MTALAARPDRARRTIDRLQARGGLPFDVRRSPRSGLDLLVAREGGLIVPLGHVIKSDDHPLRTAPACPPSSAPRSARRPRTNTS
jgi:hypothetical protein